MRIKVTSSFVFQMTEGDLGSEIEIKKGEYSSIISPTDPETHHFFECDDGEKEFQIGKGQYQRFMASKEVRQEI